MYTLFLCNHTLNNYIRYISLFVAENISICGFNEIRDIGFVGYIDQQWTGLTISLLHDIFDIHRCFVFINYRHQQYKSNDFINDINNNTFFQW